MGEHTPKRNPWKNVYIYLPDGQFVFEWEHFWWVPPQSNTDLFHSETREFNIFDRVHIYVSGCVISCRINTCIRERAIFFFFHPCCSIPFCRHPCDIVRIKTLIIILILLFESKIEIGIKLSRNKSIWGSSNQTVARRNPVVTEPFEFRHFFPLAFALRLTRKSFEQRVSMEKYLLDIVRDLWWLTSLTGILYTSSSKPYEGCSSYNSDP